MEYRVILQCFSSHDYYLPTEPKRAAEFITPFKGMYESWIPREDDGSSFQQFESDAGLESVDFSYEDK